MVEEESKHASQPLPSGQETRVADRTVKAQDNAFGVLNVPVPMSAAPIHIAGDKWRVDGADTTITHKICLTAGLESQENKVPLLLTLPAVNKTEKAEETSPDLHPVWKDLTAILSTKQSSDDAISVSSLVLPETTPSYPDRDSSGETSIVMTTGTDLTHLGQLRMGLESQFQPTLQPKFQPNYQPQFRPNPQPQFQPSSQPKIQPILQPEQFLQPLIQPYCQPSYQPQMQPTQHLQLIIPPQIQPNSQPQFQPKTQPQFEPQNQPNIQPKLKPDFQPTSLRNGRDFTKTNTPSLSSLPTIKPSPFAVACYQCHVRKIKCSGLMSDKGCRACRNAAVTCTRRRRKRRIIKPKKDGVTKAVAGENKKPKVRRISDALNKNKGVQCTKNPLCKRPQYHCGLCKIRGKAV